MATINLDEWLPCKISSYKKVTKITSSTEFWFYVDIEPQHKRSSRIFFCDLTCRDDSHKLTLHGSALQDLSAASCLWADQFHSTFLCLRQARIYPLIFFLFIGVHSLYIRIGTQYLIIMLVQMKMEAMFWFQIRKKEIITLHHPSKWVDFHSL